MRRIIDDQEETCFYQDFVVNNFREFLSYRLSHILFKSTNKIHVHVPLIVLPDSSLVEYEYRKYRLMR